MILINYLRRLFRPTPEQTAETEREIKEGATKSKLETEIQSLHNISQMATGSGNQGFHHSPYRDQSKEPPAYW